MVDRYHIQRCLFSPAGALANITSLLTQLMSMCPACKLLQFPLQTGDPADDAAKLEQYKKGFPKIAVNGESPVDITLRVRNPHGGGISGRIVSANGAAAAFANVHAMKTGPGDFGASIVADENGAYQFRGLLAGEYVISADPAFKKTKPDGPRAEGMLGSTYFPSTVDSHASPPIVVLPDREVSDINISLAVRSLHTAAGTIKAEGDGHPIASATVRLNRTGADRGNGSSPAMEAAMYNYFSTTDAQGRWLLDNLPDGMYAIDVRPTGLVGAKVERFVDKRQDLTVAGADVENLAIEVSLGGRVSGQVTVEKRSAPAPDISIGIGSAITKVDANGEFTATGVPDGEFPLSVMIRPQNLLYAKSIEVNGIDLLREKLKTRTGEEIKNVRVVLAPAPASVLTGRVLSSSEGTPLSRVAVMLIPADPSTGPAFSRPNGSTNQQGVFTVCGAPGEYFLVLWSPGEPLPPHDVDAIRKLSKATRITLGPGERKSMDLLK